MSDTEKLVNWSNWPEYIDVDDKTKARPTLDAFTKQTGIKVNYTEDYNDNDEFYAKVRPLLDGGHGHRARRLVQHRLDGGAADPPGLRPEARPGQHPQPRQPRGLAASNVEFDPGRLYSLPWQSGFAGIAYNPKATGGKKIESRRPAAHRPGPQGQGHAADRDARHRRASC